MREVNPRVYELLLTAQAKLIQIGNGFNYLGYPDDYVPPWRFAFLLERSRYFTEHAKNAQREYLNFLGNAEREEFQELSAAQNVEMEKSNVRIETARVDQVRLEIKVAVESAELAELTRSNAAKRIENYRTFDEVAEDQETMSRVGAAGGVLGGVISGAASGGIVGAIGGLLSGAGSAVQQEAQLAVAEAQRDYEMANLKLAEKEARQAAVVSRAALKTAQAGLLIAGLQRQASLLRHEYALQNLNFLRNRSLDSELWYRLSGAIRSVSETYLRYAVELAFLAEQAYEFEADKKINVIRFDYDISEVGDYLAGDFLLRDLDTLEQDLIVNQRARQQHARYVLSMAREYPAALEEIRETGKATFSLVVEQIEQRLPGLFNVRLGSVDVLPVALMDTTRFSLELQHLGSAQVRLKADGVEETPGDVPGWKLQTRTTGPETAVFSGLSRQEAASTFAYMTNGQRNAFEGLGAASSWLIDFSAKGNQVVPGSLSDLLITFAVSGYHDGELRRTIEAIDKPPTAVTRFFSARNVFPDAFFDFQRSGKLVWNISESQLALAGEPGALRNLSFVFKADTAIRNFGNLIGETEVKFRIEQNGELTINGEMPEITIVFVGPMRVRATANTANGADLSWNFGDNSSWEPGASTEHAYARPGRYELILRIVRNGRLTEYRGDVVISRAHADAILPPVCFAPRLRWISDGTVPAGLTRVVTDIGGSSTEALQYSWRLDARQAVKSQGATFDLAPGRYTLRARAVRPLRARIHSHQCHRGDVILSMDSLSISTNRRFAVDGAETTGSGGNPEANALTSHIMQSLILSPADSWTCEFRLSDNPFLASVGPTDVLQLDFSQVSDAILSLEYDTDANV